MPHSPRPVTATAKAAPASPPRSERARLDVLLVERGLADSREKAQALVLAGAVRVGKELARKPSELHRRDAPVEVAAGDRFVSRGGLKLEHALERFGIEVAGHICLDVGASTGGFTDCLLRRGAERVYAVDVGRGQLDWGLRNDPRVVVREQTNARHLTELPEPIDLAVADVSFISLRLVLPSIKRLVRPGGPIVALVKPQFEAGRGQVGRGGVVRDPSIHRRILLEAWAWCAEHGFTPHGLAASPIRGPAGNVEFLLWLTNGVSGAMARGSGELTPVAAPGAATLDAEAAVTRALEEAPTADTRPQTSDTP